MKKAIIVSGYFNPLHKGHIDYFKSAKGKADFLIVILNNDRQRALKRSKEFMLEDERAIILRELRVIDEVFISVDTDKTVCKSIEKVNSIFSKKFKLFFGNGGDQNNKTSPEVPVCNRLGIELIDGLGSKIQSSSWLLKN
ncbi:MAG: adenylyltransferase/cytidyltransferase family protein [Flavobacteriaceae bacterium]|jgi:cytidyltransferase-like protein|nr:adenylyltransferase/cytidyltransferase family protein [Flavobacteriaceae bacterium]